MCYLNMTVPKVTVYTTDYCPFCTAAKDFLKRRNIPFEEIDVSDYAKKAALKARTGMRTVPQIFIGDELIGGFQELMAAVEKVLSRLPEKSAEIFKRSRFENQSVRDIAKGMNLSEKAVEYHITKSVKFLRENLRAYHSEN